jgi:hypothetical protein
VCFDYIYNFCSKHFSFYGEISEIRLDVKYPLFLSDCNETVIFPANFRKILKCYEYPYSGSQVVACGRTDTTFPDQPRVEAKPTMYNTHINITKITSTQHTKYNEIGCTCFGLLGRHQAIIKDINKTRHCAMCQTHAGTNVHITTPKQIRGIHSHQLTHFQSSKHPHKTEIKNIRSLHKINFTLGHKGGNPSLYINSQHSRFHCSMYIVTVCMYTLHVCVYIHTYTYIHTHTHTQTNKHTHTTSQKVPLSGPQNQYCLICVHLSRYPGWHHSQTSSTSVTGTKANLVSLADQI